jgi:hypothetical protein
VGLGDAHLARPAAGVEVRAVSHFRIIDGKRVKLPSTYAVRHYTKGDREMGKVQYFPTIESAEAHAQHFLRGAKGRRATMEYLIHVADGPWEVVKRRTIKRRQP